MIDTKDYRDTPSGGVSLLEVMGTEVTVVNAARVSFGKRTDLLSKSDEKLLKYLWVNRHTSPFEKVALLFHVKCPIPIAKQWMRHRTWSYNEISRRYTSENIEFYVPETFRVQRVQGTGSKQSSSGEHEHSNIFKRMCEDHYGKALVLYEHMIDEGVAKEQARFVLPQGLMTEFYAKTDLKNLLDFLLARRNGDAQEEIRDPSNAIAEMITPLFPTIMKIVNSGRWVWVENNGES